MPMRMRGGLPGSLEGAFMNGSCGGGSGSGPVCSRLEPPSPTRSSDHEGLCRSFQLSARLFRFKSSDNAAMAEALAACDERQPPNVGGRIVEQGVGRRDCRRGYHTQGLCRSNDDSCHLALPSGVATRRSDARDGRRARSLGQGCDGRLYPIAYRWRLCSIAQTRISYCCTLGAWKRRSLRRLIDGCGDLRPSADCRTAQDVSRPASLGG
jgi:hypothetical protein